MEFSIGGLAATRGYRPTINSYQYGEAVAISKLAKEVGDNSLSKKYKDRASQIEKSVVTKLWDEDAKFFKVLSIKPNSKHEDVRELIGYTPWYFLLPKDPAMLTAWRQLTDPSGFKAQYGLTTAEQRHKKFTIDYGIGKPLKKKHECKWNGPVWPYATSMTLTALANVLNRYKKEELEGIISQSDFFDMMKTQHPIFSQMNSFMQQEAISIVVIVA